MVSKYEPTNGNKASAVARKKAGFETGESFVKVSGPFLMDPSLKDAERVYLITLESWAWEKDNCRPGNSEIARRCGWLMADGRPNRDKAKRIGEDLEAKGRIRRHIVVRDGQFERARIDLTGTRSWARELPVGGGVNLPQGVGQEYPTGGVNLPLELDSFTDPKKLDEGAEPLSLRETTLFRGEEPASNAGLDYVLDQTDKLRKMLGRLTNTKPGKQRNGRVTACGRWMASALDDNHSHANYCGVLKRLIKEELTPDHIARAFRDTYRGVIEGSVGVAGAYFFKAIGNIQSDLAHEEVEAEIRAGDPPPGYPVNYDEPATHHERQAAPQVAPTPAPRVHWLGPVSDRVVALLNEQAGLAAFANGKKLEKVAGLVQAELAGRYAGHGSKLYLALVEAIAFGYPIEAVDTLLSVESGKHDPAFRVDVKDCIRLLDPDPRDWLKHNVSQADRFFDFSLRPAEALIR